MALIRTAWILAAFLLGTLATPLQAAPVRDGHVSVELVTMHEGVQPGTDIFIGLRMIHDKGWHSYWISSTTGYPTKIEFESLSGADNHIMWPTPKVHEQGGIVDYVYDGTVLIPFLMHVPADLKAGDTWHLRAKVSWLMCHEECVPGEAEVSMDLPISAGPPALDETHREAFTRAIQSAPDIPAGWTFSADRDGDTVRLRATMIDERAHKPGTLYFFSSDGNIVATSSQPQKWLNDRQVELTLHLSDFAPKDLRFLKGALKASDGFNEFVSAAYILLPLDSPVPATSGVGLAAALLFGVLGGLILNLMPCVFPILGLKVMSFVKQAGQSRKAVLVHAAVFTAGVLAALWTLAGIILILRGAGESVGWGFQLQNPYVLFAGIVFFLLFGLNMLGVYEIGMGAGAVGGKLEGRRGLWGAFLSGLVAVIVATPCSAPFLGSAVGFAFASSALVLVAVFTAVGLGFSLPYFVLATFPKLLAFLPRPGMWMVRLKQGLSLLLFGTVVYLVWILKSFYVDGWFEFGSVRIPPPVFTLGISLPLVVASAFLYGRYNQPVRSRRSRVIGISSAALVLTLGILWGWPRPDMTEAGNATRETHAEIRPAFVSESEEPYFIDWQPGLPERLAAGGKTVYVDFTARWCATCQVNKAVVFGSAEIRDTFREHKIYVVKADWTRRDELISAELARWNRYAVPFNIIYAPGKTPVELPTVLTPGMVLDALKAVETPAKTPSE